MNTVDFDNPETWLTSEIHNPPSGVDVAAYQKQIDAICGLTPSGDSAVVLTWMPSMENYSRRYCEWDTAGFGTKTHLRGLYCFTTIYDDEGNPIDVPPPRWALKQWLSGRQYIDTDNIVRWEKAASGQQYLLREKRPPHPEKGRYIPLRRIGKHNNFCCVAAKKQNDICYGGYLEPTAQYLDELRLAVRIRSEEQGQDPNAPISQETLAQAAVERARYEQEQQTAAKAAMDEMVEENFGAFASHLFGGDWTKNTAMSLPPKYTQTESGLIVPK